VIKKKPWDAIKKWKCNDNKTCKRFYTDWNNLSSWEQQNLSLQDVLNVTNKCPNGNNDFKQSFCNKKTGLDGIINWGCTDSNSCQRAYNEWDNLSSSQQQEYGIDKIKCLTKNCTQDFYRSFCIKKGIEDGTKNWNCPQNYY
jgi:hypothetical protein